MKKTLLLICTISLITGCSEHNQKNIQQKISVVSENYEQTVQVKQNAYIHLSIDDVSACIRNLVANDYATIFDEPLIGYLKELHNEYGAVFSLYVMYIEDTFSGNIPTKYQKEFTDNSDWLKIGFHQYTSGALETDYDTAKKYYSIFADKAYALCGNYNSIDHIPRLDYYGGSLDVCKGLRDADYGIVGLLSADDSRDAYYLSKGNIKELKDNDIYYDANNELTFIDTDFRLDWFMGDFTSNYEYDVPQKNNPYDELVYRYEQSGVLDDNLIVFTHEWKIYEDGYLNDYSGMLEDVCRFAKDYQYDFDYPQNRIE